MARKQKSGAATIQDLASQTHMVINVTVPIDLYMKACERLESNGSTIDDLVRLHLRAYTSSRHLYGLRDTMGFGKYRDELIETIIRTDPDYVMWALRTTERFGLKQDAANLLLELTEDGNPIDGWGDDSHAGSWHGQD
jgi:hypothetical protein